MSQNYSILNLLNIQCKFTKLSDKSVIDMKTHLEVYLEYKRTPHYCPNCSSHSFVVKERPVQKVKWLSSSGRKVFLILKKTRWKCKCCNTTVTPSPNYLKRNNRIANDVKYKIATELATTYSMTSIARKHNVSINTVIRILRSNFNSTKPYWCRKLPRVLLIDEFKSTKKAKGNMSFIIIDGETGKIFDIVESRTKYHLRKYFLKFDENKRNHVKYVAMDMYRPYVELVNELFENATICFDKFHVVNHIGRAFLKTRIRIMKKFSTNSREYKLLKKNWKLLQKCEDDLNDLKYKPRKQLRYEQLTTRQLAHRIAKIDDELWVTYRSYQNLLYACRSNNKSYFKTEINRVINDDSSSYELRHALLSLEENIEYIFNNMEHGYNTGKVENTIRFIKQMKNNAFGFKSYLNMKIRILIKFNLIRIKNV